jgi:hypothetical protein
MCLIVHTLHPTFRHPAHIQLRTFFISTRGLAMRPANPIPINAVPYGHQRRLTASTNTLCDSLAVSLCVAMSPALGLGDVNHPDPAQDAHPHAERVE